MAEYTSSIELKAVTRDLDKKLAKVSRDLKGIDATVQKTQGSFKKMTTQVSKGFDKLNKKLKENRAAIAGIAVAVSGIALKGVSDFKKFQDGIAQIATLGVKDLKKVEKQLDNVRKQFGITGAEATKGYYDIISAGAKEGAQALDQLTAATKLAKAGNTDLAGAIDIVTSGMNIFGKSGETATSITDKLFQAVKFGKTTVEELGSTFGFVAPIIAAAGLGMDDYAASMAAVTAGGIQTNQATTGVKAVLSNLIKVTPKAEKAAKRLGIEFGTAALESKGLVGVMEDIKRATKGDVQELGKLFDSIEAINTVAVMTSDQGLASLKRNMEAMKTSAGSTASALDIVKESASFNFSKFNASMSIMSKNIGAAVVPGLIDMANAMQPVVDFLANLIAQNPGIVKVTIAITALATSLAFLGGPVTLGIVALGGAFVILLKKFKAFEVGGVKAFELLQLTWSNFIAGFQDMSVADIFKKMFDNSIGWIGKMMTKVKDKMSDLWSFFADPVSKAATAVEGWFAWVYNEVVGNSHVPDMITRIEEEMLKLWGIFADPVKEAVNAVSKYFKDLAAEDLSPSDTVKTMWTDFTTALKSGWDKATAAVKMYWEATKGLTVVSEEQTDMSTLEESSKNVVTNFLRSAAALGMVNSMLRMATAVTLMWKGATDGLGIAGATPLTGFDKLSKIKFTGLRGEIQKTTQVLRELRAASTDDLAGGNTTDEKTTKRALKNATKFEESLRKNRINNARSAGQEVIEIRAAQQAKVLEKLVAEADAKGIKLERGFMSRFFFGEGTMHTFGEKFQGLLRKIGNNFDKLTGKLSLITKDMDAFTKSSQRAGIIAEESTAKQNVVKAQKNVKNAKFAANKAVLDAPIINRATAIDEIVRTEMELAKAEEELKKAKAKELKAVKKSSLLAKQIAGDNGKVLTFMDNLRVNIQNWKMGVISKSGYSVGLLLTMASKSFTLLETNVKGWKLTQAVTSSLKLKESTMTFTKGLNAVAKIMGGLGTGFAVFTEQGTKVARSGALLGEKVANSKTVARLGKGVVGMANFAKLPQAMKVLGMIARKVLIPIFAVVDAFKGFTSTEELQKNLDSEATEFTIAQKSISAISEAIGNFFGGFLHLGGMIADYFGADHMAEYLSGIDLAPQVAKFFKGMKNIFDAIVNIARAIFGGDEDGKSEESAFTKVIKRVGSLLSGLMDTFLAITEAIAGITSGEIGLGEFALDIATALGTFFGDVAQALIDGLASAIKGLAGLLGDMLSSLYTSIKDWAFGLFDFGGKKDNKKITLAQKNAGMEGEVRTNRSGNEYATGGPVWGAGTGTSDSIPAMLSNGEYVINAKQTGKHRALLEAINGGRSLPAFKDGGEVGKSYQFLQFQRNQSPHADTKGGKGSFDLTRTMRLFVNNLDQTNPRVKEVTEMMRNLKEKTSNLTEEQALEHDYTRRINRLLLELNKETKDLAVVTDTAAGSVQDLGTSAEGAANAWEGVGSSFTAPIKDAFMQGGSILDGLKMGLHDMMRNIAGKFLDRAFAPIEASIDNMLQGFINNIGTSLTNVSSGAGASAVSGSGTLGGFIKSIFMSDGGIVPQYLNNGGVASGYGPKGSDTVPAWLTPGEVVLNAGQQKDVAKAMGNGGGATYNTYNLEISGNVDQRAINQIKEIIQSSPNEVNNAANTGKRNSSGIRRTR